MNNNENSVNNNDLSVSDSEGVASSDKDLVALTKQRIQQTHQLVGRVTRQLRVQRTRLSLLYLRDQQLFERCLQQQEVIKRQVERYGKRPLS